MSNPSLPPPVRPPPLARSIAEAIGNTPCIELSLLARHPDLLKTPNGLQIPHEKVRLLCKLEYLQPGLSKKDRAALHLILSSLDSGALKKGQTVVELTSGNTGTGLAIVCRALGHPFIAVMSKGNSMERAKMMRALGARVELVDQAEGGVVGQVSGRDLELVELRAREIVDEVGGFRADQFRLDGNSRAHYVGTGPELLVQSGQRIDVFADFVGTGGSFAGISRYLKEQCGTFCVAAEPLSSRVLAGFVDENQSHKIQGGGYSFENLPLLDKSLVDAYVGISDSEAINGARILATEEGIFAGFSAGANLMAALKALGIWWDRERRTERSGGRENGDADSRDDLITVAFLACDSGLKYFSTDLFSP